MKRVLNLLLGLAVFGALFLYTVSFAKAYGQATDGAIASRTAEIDGVKLHYLTAGHGTPLILLHGYAETSRMWRPIIPTLAERFTVISPDLPGIGDSDIPADGLDMKSAAVRIHDLAKSLGVQKAEVVGHDIGLMVAYAYAAQFPAEVTKLVLMDAFLPGVEGWEAIYNNPNIWHFRFNGPTPEALVQGRERTYFAYFWNDLAADKTRSLPEADREAVERHLNFARNLHIETRILEGEDAASVVVDFGRRNQVTQIFVTRPQGWSSLPGLSRDPVQKIIGLAKDMQIVIVSDREPVAQ